MNCCEHCIQDAPHEANQHTIPCSVGCNDEAPIYTLIEYADDGTIRDMEHFAEEPTFLDDHPGRWDLRIGNLNGGDSILTRSNP